MIWQIDTARKKLIRLICTAPTSTWRSRAIAGKAGRYMSMANGPMAESMPRTSALRRKADFMKKSFRGPDRKIGIDETACGSKDAKETKRWTGTHASFRHWRPRRD